jgi:Icc-related predicted phosphoesterase
MLIRHISDSHGRHQEYKSIPCDIIIHSGDESNQRNPIDNQLEFDKFIDWYKDYPAKHKILVPGNHSTYIEANLSWCKRLCKEKGVTILVDELIEIEGLTIFGTPYTHTFGNWVFTLPKEGIGRRCLNYPKADILITHGPPKGVLDSSPFDEENSGERGQLKYCQKYNPLIHMFGHIHSSVKSNIINTGICEIQTTTTVFSNATAINDGDRIGKIPIYQGNMFEITDKKIVNKWIIR